MIFECRQMALKINLRAINGEISYVRVTKREKFRKKNSGRIEGCNTSYKKVFFFKYFGGLVCFKTKWFQLILSPSLFSSQEPRKNSTNFL